jgi:hypothetical protein
MVIILRPLSFYNNWQSAEVLLELGQSRPQALSGTLSDIVNATIGHKLGLSPFNMEVAN